MRPGSTRRLSLNLKKIIKKNKPNRL